MALTWYSLILMTPNIQILNVEYNTNIINDNECILCKSGPYVLIYLEIFICLWTMASVCWAIKLENENRKRLYYSTKNNDPNHINNNNNKKIVMS